MKPEQINQECYVDVNANKAVFDSLKKNPKVHYDGERFSYKVTLVTYVSLLNSLGSWYFIFDSYLYGNVELSSFFCRPRLMDIYLHGIFYYSPSMI